MGAYKDAEKLAHQIVALADEQKLSINGFHVALDLAKELVAKSPVKSVEEFVDGNSDKS